MDPYLCCRCFDAHELIVAPPGGDLGVEYPPAGLLAVHVAVPWAHLVLLEAVEERLVVLMPRKLVPEVAVCHLNIIVTLSVLWFCMII